MWASKRPVRYILVCLFSRAATKNHHSLSGLQQPETDSLKDLEVKSRREINIWQGHTASEGPEEGSFPVSSQHLVVFPGLQRNTPGSASLVFFPVCLCAFFPS